MGGLVASGYMAMGTKQLNKVQQVYMLSSPLEGTPEVINVWSNIDFSSLSGSGGKDFILILNSLLALMTVTYNPIQKLFSNYQSVYELFPTKNYLALSPTPYLTDYVSANGVKETDCTDYTSSMKVLSECLPDFSSALMEKAEAFHASCRINNKHISYAVSCEYLYSTGTATNTQMRHFTILSEYPHPHGIEIKTTVTTGDGLVPDWSATLGRSGSNVTAFSPHGHMYVAMETVPIDHLVSRLQSLR